MSQTRNQRDRHRRVVYRIALAVVTVILILSIALAAYLWAQVEALRKEAHVYVPVISLDMLPEYFNEAEYAAAQQRYIIEEGLSIPEFTIEGVQ